MEFQLTGRHPLLRTDLRMRPRGRDRLVIDASRLLFASPLDLAAAAAMAHTHAAAGAHVVLVTPHDGAVTSYLQRMGLIRLLPDGTRIDGDLPSERRTDRSGVLLELSPLSPASADALAVRLGALAAGHFSDPLGKQAFADIGELLDNAVTHGPSDLGGFVCAQAYSGRTTGARRLEVAVCDTGIGVLAHLRRNPAYQHLYNCAQALECALKPGVTGTRDQVRGNGLPDLLRLSRHTSAGRLVLRSGDGLARVGKRQNIATTQCWPTRTPITGAWAWLRIRSDQAQPVLQSIQ